MSDRQKIAVVTGANRGLGLETSRQLAERGIQVILTSRDENKGKGAVEKLQSEGLNVLYCQLEVTDDKSVQNLAKFIRDRFGYLDILVNNAGKLIDSWTASVFDTKTSTLQETIETNLYGPFYLCQALIPLMKVHNYGRVVNVSSGAGQLSDMQSGYPAYRMSKTALNALTRILANELQGTNILINSLCPGWVRTDMGGPNATRTIEQGVETIVWLATLNDGSPSGLFWRDRQPIDW
ncbi:MAG: SDR family oxidoreductase [Cyanosarcina radialis HA8281-LM2]|jgi:NAD(P)-dependent dehydrogenase (short-subunit alcohol dehydrogenase family)|nr:SDR family oxidoreductase [Cyanosarcina radialis HA8281-LM2]